MKQEEFDEWYDEDRKELADEEYSDPLAATLEDEEDIDICTCAINPRKCVIHKITEEDGS